MGRSFDQLPPWLTIAVSFVGTIALLNLADNALQSPLANHPPAAGHRLAAASLRLPADLGHTHRAANPPMPTVPVPELLPPTEGGPAELPLSAVQPASMEAAASFCPTLPEAAPVLPSAEELHRLGDTGRLPAENALGGRNAPAVRPIWESVPCDRSAAPALLPRAASGARQAPFPPALHLPAADRAEQPVAEEAPAAAPIEVLSEPGRRDASPPARRSWNLELIARQADQHTRRGCELAKRKAIFSARLEFTRALRLIAQGLDAEEQTAEHSKALAAGLRAMTEAEDFLPNGGRLEADLDVPAIAGAHTTPVLHGGEAQRVSPLEAMRRYFDYAQAQLAAAAGNEIAGSVALHSLGKLYVVMADQPVDPVAAAESKAMVFFQAALIAAPRNYIASNELGVLLARAGRYQEATAAFQHSLAVHKTAEVWRNLALTCEQLGDMGAAHQAAAEVIALRSERQAWQNRLAGGKARVQWVEPEVFAGQTSPSAGAADAAPATAARAAGGGSESNIR